MDVLIKGRWCRRMSFDNVRRTRWKGGTVTRSGRRGSGREWNDVANGLEMCELYGGGDSEKLRSKQRNVNYKVN